MDRVLDTDRPIEQRPLLGMGLRLLTALLLSIMLAGVKYASQRGVHVAESLFYRQVGSALCASLWIGFGPGFASVRTKRIRAHVSRMAIGLTGMLLIFSSSILLPLAEATAIGFSVPIFSTLLAALVLGEPTGKWRWGAILIGFVGVIIIVQPTGSHVSGLGVAVAITSALVTAIVTIVIRRLGATEAAPTIVFWFAVSSLVPLSIAMLFFGQAHDPYTWGVIAVMALAGGAAQLTLTGALRLAPVALVMPMDYTSLIWASLFGFILFDQLPSAWTWLGAPVIIGSGLIILWREHRLNRDARLAPPLPR